MDYQAELEETQRSLREITLMIEQSQGELAKITQRNTAITSHLQQVQRQGSGPADEIKMAYDSALDAQQRLFVMRGQLEKLQNDKTHLRNIRQF
jgi:two-component system sensor histidine kinase DegS